MKILIQIPDIKGSECTGFTVLMAVWYNVNFVI